MFNDINHFYDKNFLCKKLYLKNIFKTLGLKATNIKKLNYAKCNKNATAIDIAKVQTLMNIFAEPLQRSVSHTEQ